MSCYDRFIVICLVSVFCLVVKAMPNGTDSSSVIIGNIRVSALSPTLMRIEPRGPKGFEDRSTFSIIGRQSFSGIPLEIVSQSNTTVNLKTNYYNLSITEGPVLDLTCSDTIVGDIGLNGVRSISHPDGVWVGSQDKCCEICKVDAYCRLWIYNSDKVVGFKNNCWLMNSYTSVKTTNAKNRVIGCNDSSGCLSRIKSLLVTDPSGKVLISQNEGPDSKDNLLFFPSPLTASAYLMSDFPRFSVPEWDVMPVPKDAKIDPTLIGTNGYDFTNNINGDVYVFLLGNNMDDYYKSRKELLQLTGPTPILPDYAFGTWFTWCNDYSEAMAKDDIYNWNNHSLPLDVWSLDMNWRKHVNNDHDYIPNTDLFPSYTEFFSFLKTNDIKIFFNDHPFPVADQTSPKEIEFRWNGLTSLMEQGLTFWWFDHNWGFSIPPPQSPPLGGWDVSHTDAMYYGLDNAAWGSHVYYTTVAQFTQNYRNMSTASRPMALSKFAKPDWKSGMDPMDAAESPAHHRYPVWWTGDGLTVQSSTQSMVDSGVHALKPYVHSDCGGDATRGEGPGLLLRWTAHCAFGTIFRFHGDDHRPWTFDTNTLSVIKSYLDIRYRLSPSLVAAGHVASTTGFPIVARCDLFWPNYIEARSNDQYIHLQDTLIAPMFETATNITSRRLWVPPGEWQDAWTGNIVVGPSVVVSSQPYERQPMFHRRGGVLVMLNHGDLRINDQDWSELLLQIFPMFSNTGDVTTIHRSLYSKSPSAYEPISETLWTGVSITTTTTTSASGNVTIDITKSMDSVRRSWILRFHLLRHQRLSNATMDGVSLTITHIDAVDSSYSISPPALGSIGAAPASGVIAEVTITSSNSARRIDVTIATVDA